MFVCVCVFVYVCMNGLECIRVGHGSLIWFRKLRENMKDGPRLTYCRVCVV